jgi:hypothetical protein
MNEVIQRSDASARFALTTHGRDDFWASVAAVTGIAPVG